MLAWFHTFSNLQIGAMLLFTGLSVTTVIPSLLRHRFKIKVEDNMSRGAEESFKLFISLSLLLLAFCMVRAMGDYRGAEDIVSREATVMLKMDRAYESFGTDDTDAMRLVLRTYADHLINDEWPVLAKGERASTASEDLRVISTISKQLEPQTP
jgi:hypothetical protein